MTTWYIRKTEDGIYELVIRWQAKSNKLSVMKRARKILKSLGISQPVIGEPIINEDVFPPKWKDMRKCGVFVLDDDYKIILQKKIPHSG